MSKKYTGYTCSICNQVFKDSDDVVTCPDCGTPFHRTCYQQTGHCPFENQHGTMPTWTEENHIKQIPINATTSTENTGSITCHVCGRVNPPDALFCAQCGNPLNNGTTPPQFQSLNQLFGIPTQNSTNQSSASPQNPYNSFPPMYGMPLLNPDYLTEEQAKEKLDDHTLGDIADAVGDNTGYFIRTFRRLSQSFFPLSSNLSAFFAGPYYFLYRKMYLPGIIYFIVQLAFHGLFLFTTIKTMPYTNAIMENQMDMSALPAEIQTLSVYASAFFSFLLLLATLSGFFFNYFYKNKIFKLIDKTHEEKKDAPEQIKSCLKKAGGVNKNIPLIALSFVAILYFAVLFIYPMFITI